MSLHVVCVRENPKNSMLPFEVAGINLIEESHLISDVGSLHTPWDKQDISVYAEE